MSTGPRYARRTDANHAELREVFRQCGCNVLDISNLGGKVSDLIVQYRNWGIDGTRSGSLVTHLIEIKSGKKKKLTKSQSENPLELVRIDCRADIFELLNREDWEK